MLPKPLRWVNQEGLASVLVCVKPGAKVTSTVSGLCTEFVQHCWFPRPSVSTETRPSFFRGPELIFFKP
jgi:hypothetical protein